MSYKSHRHVQAPTNIMCLRPKCRHKVLANGVDKRLKEIICEVAKELGCEVMELEAMPDHVHILCEVDPQFGVHKFVKYVKGHSSRLLRQEFPHLKSRLPALWTYSYFVSTGVVHQLPS